LKLKNYHNVYLIGIGGIGMSSLARWFKRSGLRVAGYDKTETKLTAALQSEDITIHFEDDIDFVPSAFKDQSNTLVVFTPAIPDKHSEFKYFKKAGFKVIKRSEALGLITKRMKTIAVAGTHGKTTTCSIIAHILKQGGESVVAFLGGIATNYGTNFIAPKKIGNEAIAVVEADEFDRSFLALKPKMAVVTSADADHLDIYGDSNALRDSFKEFIKRIKSKGSLFINEKIADELVERDFDRPVYTYGINQGQFFASNITVKDGFFVFSYRDELHNIDDLRLGVPGLHNIENATAAVAVALKLGVKPAKIKEALSSYEGVKRRFEYVIKHENLVMVDDYAHHPVEINALLKSLRVLYPGKKITAIFQPHLYSRTKDFAAEFADSLSQADEVIMLDIYPAREEPIEGVTSDLILKDINTKYKITCKKVELIQELDKLNLEVLATIGAGDIDKLVDPVREHLNKKYHAA